MDPGPQTSAFRPQASDFGAPIASPGSRPSNLRFFIPLRTSGCVMVEVRGLRSEVRSTIASHAPTPLAEDRLDGLARGLGPGVLAAVRRAEFPLLLRYRKS